MVSLRTSPVVLRRIDARTGPIHTIDQLLNPDTVVITVGGFFAPSVLIAGSLGAAHDTSISRALFASWRRPIRRMWRKRKSAYLGPQALEAFEAGSRLTWSASGAREFDLA